MRALKYNSKCCIHYLPFTILNLYECVSYRVCCSTQQMLKYIFSESEMKALPKALADILIQCNFTRVHFCFPAGGLC